MKATICVLKLNYILVRSLHLYKPTRGELFMKNLLLALCFLTVYSTAHADYEIENAFFYIRTYKALCANCAEHYRGESFTGNQSKTVNMNDKTYSTAIPNADLDYKNHYLMTGWIEINEVDIDSHNLRKTVIDNITLKIEAIGLIVDLTRGGNSRMRIKGLHRHQAQDIFASTFVGWRFRGSFLLQLGMMRADNDNGIMIVDNDDLFGFGYALDFYKVKLRFGLDPAKQTIVNAITNQKTGEIFTVEVSVEEALKRRIN